MDPFLNLNLTTAEINISDITKIRTKYLDISSNQTQIDNLSLDSVVLKNGNFSWKLNVSSNGDLIFFKSIDDGKTFTQRQIFN